MIKNQEIKKTIVLRELESRRLVSSELSFLPEDKLKSASEALKDLASLSPDFGGEYVIRAGTTVGVIETEGLRLEVRPRLSADEFMTFIRFSLSGKVPPKNYRARANLWRDHGFEDVLCLMLALEVKEILRIGLSRKYVEKIEPLEVIRGRPVWQNNFPWRGAESRELVCRHSRITYDNLDNQIVLAGLRMAMQLVRHKDVRKDITQTLRVFQQLATEKVIDAFHFDQVAGGYNRLNEHYEALHQITKMLLYGLRSRSVYSEGPTRVYGLALDMPFLFEKFAQRLIESVLAGSEFKLFSQTGDRGALLDSTGQTYAGVRPDYQVRKGNELVAVLDAKYKDYWPMDKTGQRPNRKVANEDLYQLFFYQQRLKQKYNLTENPPAIIISQLPDEDEREGRLTIPERYKRIIYQAGDDTSGDVTLIFLPVTRFLRLLDSGLNVLNAAEKIGLMDFINTLKWKAA